MTFPEFFNQNRDSIQWGMGFTALAAVWSILKSGKNESQFKVREADRKDLNRLREGPDLAQAKLKRPAQAAPPPPPLSLPGIRLHGEAHEILGVAENASEAEVMRAYKDAIKRFHPDRIQGQAKEQMQFYEQASAKLNQAKEDMLKRIRS